MSLYSKEYDRSNPEVAEKLDTLDYLNRSATLNIHSWADFYSHVDTLREASFSSLEVNPLMVALAAFQSAFFKAMEGMPDEGDIKKLLYRTHEILVMEPEVIGVKMFATRREQYEMMVSSLRQAVAKANEASDSADGFIRKLMRGGDSDQNPED